MSKVTIKFWDKEVRAYVENAENLAIDGEGRIFQVTHTEAQCDDPECSKGDHFIDDVSHFEPHFYKDGERIDE